MTALLDANVLIALVVTEHVHHDAATDWLASSDASFATCPITQGSLVRFLVRMGQPAATARDVVHAVANAKNHEFWPDSVSFADVTVGGVVGHRQVTDAYLAQLARSHKGQLATLDSGLAHLHSDVAMLIPTATDLLRRKGQRAVCSRRASPLARTARRPIAARTDGSEPTTRTFDLARVTAV